MEDTTGFICSYSQSHMTRCFHGSEETDSTVTEMVSKDYYYYSLREAQEACRKKYKELLLR